MKDETKELFDAPWVADACCEIHDKNESLVCICCPGEPHIANRLARLPELYDALIEAAGGKCWSCAGENTETMLDHPCPKGHDEDCYVAKWRELLRKVRDGE